MNEITLKRGGRDIRFKKMPEHFAVRLGRGRAMSSAALEAASGRPRAATRHVDSAVHEFKVFAVEDPQDVMER